MKYLQEELESREPVTVSVWPATQPPKNYDLRTVLRSRGEEYGELQRATDLERIVEEYIPEDAGQPPGFVDWLLEGDVEGIGERLIVEEREYDDLPDLDVEIYKNGY